MLVILELGLNKYKRFRLQDIKRFHIKINEIYQLIIGTNGSGKSSIMRELTPMPANHKDYDKGGSKIIVILFNGMVYRLISDFTHGNNHEFHIADATNFDPSNYDLETLNFTNLNEGRTAKAQKILVETHFNIDQEILDVLLGDVKFSSMPALKRRDWILRLVGGDLEYAIQVHRKLTHRVNDQIAVIKHTNRRINDEQAKMISDAEYTALESLVNEYTGMLNDLYNVPLVHDLNNSETYFNNSKTAIANAMSQVEQYKRAANNRPSWFNIEIHPGTAFEDSMAILNVELENIRQEFRTSKETMNYLYENAEAINQQLEQLRNAYQGNIDDLILEKNAKQAQYDLDLATYAPKFGLNLDYPEEAASTWRAIHDQLIGIFTTIEDNSTRKFSRAERDKTKSLIDIIQGDLAQNNRAMQKFEHQLDHLRNAERNTCPKCAHTWVAGIPESLTVDSLQREINRVAEMIRYDTSRLKEMNEYLEACATYNSYLGQFSAIVKSNPIHSTLWDKLEFGEVYFNPPMYTLNTFANYNLDVEASVTFSNRLNEIRSMQMVIDQAKALEGSKAEVSESLLEDVNSRIRVIHTTMDELTRKESELKTWIYELNTLNTLYTNAMNDVERSFQQMITGWEASAAELVNNHRSELQLNLANTNSALQEAKNVIMVHEMLKSTLSTERTTLDVCATLADTLSPKNGLIAECLRMIIQQLTEKMNSVLSQIWTYPLEVLPCPEEEDENAPSDLKYRFPLSIEHGQNVTGDISQGSSAQKDGVDFAFVVCVYMYLGLEGWPLWLDELAPTMDEMHRINIIQMVKLLIESRRNSQMFMISHYISGHGTFTNAEICLLNDKNIINKPHTYNEHVTIK